MALKTDIRGMVWEYPEPFAVGREQIRREIMANAVGEVRIALFHEGGDPLLHIGRLTARLQRAAVNLVGFHRVIRPHHAPDHLARNGN